MDDRKYNAGLQKEKFTGALSGWFQSDESKEMSLVSATEAPKA
jgi:hypothetical protein